MSAERIHHSYVKITVSFENRDDGGLRAWSDDVPGFVLSGSDPAAVMSDVEPALELILSEMFGATAKLDKLVDASSVLPQRRLPLPSTAPLRKREYVSKLAA